MKKLVILILVVAAGYMAYQKFGGGSLSDEQKQVRALAGEFAAAKQQLAQAERSAGVSGMDTTGDGRLGHGGGRSIAGETAGDQGRTG